MTEIRFTIPGPPVPKARARTVRMPNGRVRSYTPARTADYERAVMGYATQAKHALPRTWLLLEGDRYGLSVTVYRAAKRGDLDNYLKSAKDGLNGVLWRDDKQVVEYGDCALRDDKDNPRMEVRVWRIE